MKKRMLSLLLASTLAFSMTGFVNASEGETDIWARYDETVTLTTIKSDLSSIIYPEGEDINNNAWTKEYQERFNIELVNEWVSDDYDTKLNLQIAEGKLPDVFIVNATQLKQLVQADMLCDLTEVYDTYASDLVKSSEAADQTSFESGMFDGKLYGLAQLGYGSIAQPDYVWIRQDWLAESGLEAPKTMDDLVTIAKTFMTNYGGYGIAADKSLEFLNLIAIGWGAHPNMWVRDAEGNIVYGSTTEEMKNALADWAQWYQEGIISKDFATTDMTKVNEDVINGKVGVMPYYNWWGYAVGADHIAKNGFDAIFRSYEIPSANGEEVLQSIYCENSTYIVVSKECENPDAVFKLINFYSYIASAEATEKEPELKTTLTTGELGHTQTTTRIFDPTTLATEWGNINHACLTGETEGMPANHLESYENIQKFLENPLENTGVTGGYCQCGFEGSPYTIANDCFENGKYVNNVLWAYTPETLGKTGSTLADILTEGFTKIILGDQPIDYFDTVVANWKAAGGEQATLEMEELYN